jgi:hypothetical protein
LSGELGDVIERAVLPDLTMLVERLGSAGNGRWWFGLRTDSAVQVTVLPDGSRAVGAIEPGSVVSQVLWLGGTSPSPDAATGGATNRVTSDEITAGSGAVSAIIRVNTAWRVGELIRGGVLTWAVGRDGSYWVAEADTEAASPTWDLRPAGFEAIRTELLDHLPGA